STALLLRAAAKKRKRRIAARVRMARSEGIAGRKCCKGEKVLAGLAFTRSRKSRAITSAQSQSAGLLVETTSERQCVRIDGWLRRPRQCSSFQGFCGGDE